MLDPFQDHRPPLGSNAARETQPDRAPHPLADFLLQDAAPGESWLTAVDVPVVLPPSSMIEPDTSAAAAPPLAAGRFTPELQSSVVALGSARPSNRSTMS